MKLPRLVTDVESLPLAEKEHFRKREGRLMAAGISIAIALACTAIVTILKESPECNCVDVAAGKK